MADKKLANYKALIDDSEKALKQKNRTTKDSDVKWLLKGISSNMVSASIAAGFVTTMAVPGLFLVTGPTLPMLFLAKKLSKQKQNEEDAKQKELLYKDAIKKQSAIIKELRNQQQADKDRIEYLTKLNIALQQAIREMEG